MAQYERYLPDTPPSFQRAWGSWVVERLALLVEDLDGRVIEIHAGSTYVDALRSPLASKGASLYEPLAALGMGQRLAWYGDASPPADEKHDRDASADTVAVHQSAAVFCERLADASSALAPDEFLLRGAAGLKVPGLYSCCSAFVPRHMSSLGVEP